MTRKTGLVFVALLLAAGMAVGQQQQQVQSGKLADTWIKDATQFGNFETQLAQTTAARVQDPQIKQFAQKVAQDFEQLKPQLQQLAQQQNVQLTQQQKGWEQALTQELEQMSPQELERAYVFHLIGDHQVALLKGEFAKQNVQNQQVKQAIEKTSPVLQQHIQEGAQLAQKFLQGQGQVYGISPSGQLQQESRQQQMLQDQQGMNPQDQQSQQYGQQPQDQQSQDQQSQQQMQ